MGKKSTSVEFTDVARDALDKLLVRDSLKNIVSSGVVVFSTLSIADREQAIQDANNDELADHNRLDLYVDSHILIRLVEQVTRWKDQSFHEAADEVYNAVLDLTGNLSDYYSIAPLPEKPTKVATPSPDFDAKADIKDQAVIDTLLRELEDPELNPAVRDQFQSLLERMRKSMSIRAQNPHPASAKASPGHCDE